MRTSLYLFLSLILLSCAPKEPTPQELAEKIIANFEGHRSVSYDIDYRIKFFSDIDDTSQVNAHVDLIRIPEDTIFGGQLWIETRDSVLRYYDTTAIYIFPMGLGKITRYKKEDDWAISGNIAGSVIETYFLNPKRLLNALKDSTITVELAAGELNGVPVWHWASLIDDDGEFKNMRKDLWIDQKDLSILKITYTADFQNENQYNEWSLSNIVFDQVTQEDLQGRFSELTENYPVEDYQRRSPEEQQPLADGTTIPELKGRSYRTGDSVALAEYKGKLLLIDFWYMDCFPCIKAIPHLNELHHKYADRGLQVVGIDPYDDNEKGLKRLPAFLENNTLDYPILFVDREDPKAFKVFAFPTFYLIDREGKVVFSQVGFGEDTAAKVDSVIQVHL